jgi:hypothetical protein
MARALLVALCVISTALANPSTAQADCDLNVFIDGWILDSSTYVPVADAEVCLGYNCVRTDAVGKFAIHDRTTVDDGQSFESRFCIDISSSGYPAKQYCVVRTKSPFPPCAGNDLTLVFDAGVLFLDSVSTGVSGLTMRPERHVLWPNSPNPFNPSTEIRFTLAAPADVALEIFDVLGRRVATPVAARLEAGPHKVEWNAEGLPSGVYFYRMNADGFSAVRKMLLLR